MSLFGLISSAYAQTPAGGQAPQSGISELLQGPLPLFAIVGLIFYFLVFRPQQQRANLMKQQLGSLRRGDSIVTAGGIIGTVARVVSDDEVAVDIAEGVRVRVVRSTITGINSKSEAPAAGNGNPSNDAEGDAAKPAKRRKQSPGETAS